MPLFDTIEEFQNPLPPPSFLLSLLFLHRHLLGTYYVLGTLLNTQ